MADSEPGELPRILFVIGGLGAGGAETQLCELVCALHGHDFEATVLVGIADPGIRLERLRAAGVSIIEAGVQPGPRPLAVARLAWRIASAIGSLRPDVVYVWLEAMSVLATPISRLRGVPVVVRRCSIGGAQVERLAGLRWLVRRAERLATLIAPNSQAVADYATRRGIDRGRLRLVPNALPPRAPVPPPVPPPVRIGYLARMRPEKGHRRLLRVLDRLPADLDWVAKLGGGGALFDVMREEAERLGLASRIEFCGEVDSADFWDDCHIGLLLSDQEGSPNSLLEAARAGRPLLATAVGGSTEVVVEGTGLLVDPADEDATAAGLARLISDPGLRARYGARARELTVARHDPESVFRLHMTVLREAIAS